MQLIGATQTRSGLQVRSEIDEGSYPTGVRVSDRDFAKVRIRKHDFHGDWNYTTLSKQALFLVLASTVNPNIWGPSDKLIPFRPLSDADPTDPCADRISRIPGAAARALLGGFHSRSGC